MLYSQHPSSENKFQGCQMPQCLGGQWQGNESTQLTCTEYPSFSDAHWSTQNPWEEKLPLIKYI